MGAMRNLCSIRKTLGEDALGRPRRRREDNIGMDISELGGKFWTGFTWLRIGRITVLL
jgi:hypothetical protein